MACGLCVVSTNVGGIPHLVHDGSNGLLVGPGDAPAFSRAILRILADPGLSSSLSRNGRRTAEQFDWPVVLPQWDALFHRDQLMKSLSDRLYLRAPIWLQGLAVGVFGCWWFLRRYGADFVRHCEELRVHDGWPEERMRKYQEERLQAILRAARGSAYYSGLLPPEDPRAPGSAFEVLAQLPLLEKGVLRERPLDLLT